MRRFLSILLTLLAAALLVGCTPTAIQPAGTRPTPITPAAGKGGLAGQVKTAAVLWPEDIVNIYAAPFTAVHGQEGYYILEPNVHPHAELLTGGYFQIDNIDPGDYVLVVGPDPREARLVVNAENKPQPFSIKAGEVLQLDAVTLAQ